MLRRLQNAAAGLTPAVRGMMWMAGSGLVFTFLNPIMRALTTEMDSLQTQFLRYFCGVLVMLPLPFVPIFLMASMPCWTQSAMTPLWLVLQRSRLGVTSARSLTTRFRPRLQK